MEKIIKEKSKIELNIKKIIVTGLILELIGTLLIFISFTKIYENINVIIYALMALNIIIFTLSIIFFKYNKKSALRYLILSIIFFFFSDKDTYILINIISLIIQGKVMY
ncbi:hypothetical protein [Clostridium perfringens]|uniref:hypothetical protein n=2 Tax=Clostridium perfringens TaxID=1502 RepID=UPI0013E38E8D|nr:hypothetical protein [Clostridium perfringens]